MFKKMRCILYLLSCFLILTIPVQAATFSILIEDLSSPSGFESFNIELDVAEDFSYSLDTLSFGSAVPDGNSPVMQATEDPIPEVITPWVFDYENPTVTSGIFSIGGYNSDAFDFSVSVTDLSSMNMGWIYSSDGQYTENNLVDGLLFSFEYEGTINGLELAEFGDYLGNTTSFQDAGITYTVNYGTVPIPSSILLLGGGIAALFGITRRKR